MPPSDAVAVTWVARGFVATGLGLMLLGVYSALDTYQFISESVLAEGIVVDWNQGTGQTGRSQEPGAYYPIIEVRSPGGQRVVGEADTGVGMNQLNVGERLPVRYRPADPARMRVVSITGLWLKELILALLAVTFATTGTVLRRQARKESPTSWAERRLQ